MTLNTRRPTGLPSWPMILLAGREKAGKTWGALTASASPLIGRTFYIGVGEDDPDEYALIPNADFEIVLHDGTYHGILQALRDAASAPRDGDKPNLLVVDSMTKIWELIVDNAQGIANKRANGRKTASGDYAVSPDLWNVAKGQWDDMMDSIRSHKGPSILTARLDEVMVMENGQPTKQKTWKIQAHKSLPFDVGVVVEMRERGKALITGVKSVRMALEKPMDAPQFTVPEMWTQLGIEAGTETSDRVHMRTVVDDPSDEAAIVMWTGRAEEQTTREGITAVWREAQTAVKGGVAPAEILDAIRDVAAKFEEKSAPEPLVTAGQAAPKRKWVSEASKLTTREEVGRLRMEATAAEAPEHVLTELEAIERKLPDPGVESPGAGWAKPEGEAAGWVQNEAGEFAEADVPAVLDETVEAAAK